MADTVSRTPQQPEKPHALEHALPKLSAAEFREYNRLAEVMNAFHNRFRARWTIMYKACESGKRPSGMSIKQFLDHADSFCEQLTYHHTYEEYNVFPELARKMPAFRPEIHLLGQHKLIHEGIDKLEAYIAECRSGEKDLRMAEMKAVLDSWAKVLWAHLDDEVQQLGAENMRKYWTLAEMKRLHR